MSHLLRDRDPSAFRHITIRTIEARLWIGISNNVEKIIGGIIARYQEILGVELYAYCVLGNHIHLVARAPRGNMDEFQENVNREISRRLNWQNRREGKLWARRYTDLKILSEDDLLEAFVYVTTNPTHHGLVSNSRKWLGLNSFEQCLKENSRRFSFHHYSAADGKRRVTHHTLRLTVLPQFASLGRAKRRRKIEDLLVERLNRIIKERGERGQGFLEIEGLRKLKIGDLPQDVSRARRPPCYTKSSELRRQYREERRLFVQRYARCSAMYRLGIPNVQFPEHCFLPPLHRLPRIAPFVLLTADLYASAPQA